MSVRSRLVMALVMALLFGGGVYLYFSNLQAATTVVVAVTDIPARTQITADMMKVIQVSAQDKELLVPGAYKSPSLIEGGIAMVDILSGEVLRQDPRFIMPRRDLPIRLAPGQKMKLAYSVPDGMRAVGVHLNAAAGVFDRLQKDDRVDVAVTGDSKNGPWSMIALYNVPILDMITTDKSSRDVILLLTPEQSLDFLVAQNAGGLTLLLNSPSEDIKKRTVPVPPSRFDRFNQQVGDLLPAKPATEAAPSKSAAETAPAKPAPAAESKR